MFYIRSDKSIKSEKRKVERERPYQNKSGALQGMLSLHDILPQRFHRRCKEAEYKGIFPG
jgi:hypothetical protein